MVRPARLSIGLTCLFSFTHVSADGTHALQPRNSNQVETPVSASCRVHHTSGPYPLIPKPGDWTAFIAQKMYNEQQDESCAVFIEAQTVGSTNIYAQGIPFTTGSNCGSTAELKTDRNGLISGVNQLRQAGGTAGCCTFQHGGGSWHAHVKFKTHHSLAYDDISCP